MGMGTQRECSLLVVYRKTWFVWSFEIQSKSKSKAWFGEMKVFFVEYDMTRDPSEKAVNHLEHEWHRNRSCFRKLAAIGQQQQLSVAATVWFRVLRLLRWYLFRRHHSVQWCFCFSHRRSPMTHFIFLIYVVCVQCDGPTDILQKYYI